MRGFMRDNIRTIGYFLILFIVVCILFSTAGAGPIDDGQIDGKRIFLEGKKALGDCRYEEAVEDFLIAQRELPLLGDYALLFLAEAYHGAGRHGESLGVIRTLFFACPESAVLRKARKIEIREAEETADEDLDRLYEAFLDDYPGDEEISFKYALFLKQHDQTERADVFFRKIYREAGPLSLSALGELSSGVLGAEDLLDRASNLIKKYDFIEAEKELKKALLLDEGENRGEILSNLGYSFFRQKRYSEAAHTYDKIRDLYFKARSLYRAGDKAGFEDTLQSLVEENDPGAALLLSAAASDKRRERKFDEALEIYEAVLAGYPEESESVTWEIGWTHYMAGEYNDAARIFSDLFSAYDNPKYLYWQARSLEFSGGEAGELYDELSKKEDNFYTAMAYARNKGGSVKSVSLKRPDLGTPEGKEELFARVDMLRSLDMPREAMEELSVLSQKISTSSEFLSVMSKFLELGEYRRVIGLASSVSYSDDLHRFRYPLAYWKEVEKISEKYDVDPMIVLSVMREESRFDAKAKSVAGALGLMQLMPQTASRLDKRLKLGIRGEDAVTDVRNNIRLGSYYLKTLSEEFPSLAHVIAAYNAGEQVVRKWQMDGNYNQVDEFIEDIPYPETRTYVKRVLTSYFQYKKISDTGTSEITFDIMLRKF
jgi:soluble lytic murein transglycosylase